MQEQCGFTLIEAVVVMALVAILLGVALPHYGDASRKARRSEAISALDALQQAQERWRANHPSYADASAWAQLGVAATDANRITSSRLYRLDIEAASSQGYAATATALSSQLGDTRCRLLRVSQAQDTTAYTSVDDAGRESAGTPNRCWAR